MFPGTLPSGSSAALLVYQVKDYNSVTEVPPKDTTLIWLQTNIPRNNFSTGIVMQLWIHHLHVGVTPLTILCW